MVRGIRLKGRRVVSIGYAYKAAGAAFILTGIGCVAVWLIPGLAGC